MSGNAAHLSPKVPKPIDRAMEPNGSYGILRTSMASSAALASTIPTKSIDWFESRARPAKGRNAQDKQRRSLPKTGRDKASPPYPAAHSRCQLPGFPCHRFSKTRRPRPERNTHRHSDLAQRPHCPPNLPSRTAKYWSPTHTINLVDGLKRHIDH